MERRGGVDYGLALYVVGVFGLSGLAIGLLGVLYVSRVPEFTDAVVENPLLASREDPVAVALILGTLLATVLLVGLIVGFGARYGPDPENRE